MKTAILAGATGLIGFQLLDILSKDASYSRVIALSRRPLSFSHPKVFNLILDLESIQQYAGQLKGDDVFCCLGTTMKQAGSKEAFKKVDLEYPFTLASITKREGARQFLLVTAMGANKNAAIFYNRVKGEVQEKIREIGFESFQIFQPSMLVGPRIERRSGEHSIGFVMKSLRFLIPKNYQAIESVKVARAMAAVAKQNLIGEFVYQSGQLQSF